MSKKSFFIGIFSILAFSAILLPTLTYADQHYDQYPGNGFVPQHSDSNCFRSPESTYIFHAGTNDEYYMCPVNFNVPDGSTYFIKSLGLRYLDDLTDGYIYVSLRRRNLYTGATHDVALWGSGQTFANASPQTYSQGTLAGYKLVDTKKFSYWLYIHFWRVGEVSPGDNLMIYQIRVHYGT
jgi:hypothetical protein